MDPSLVKKLIMSSNYSLKTHLINPKLVQIESID